MEVLRNKYLSGREPRINVTEEFVLKNNLTLSRSADEIIERIKNDDGWFGFAAEVLSPYLSWEDAKQFYRDDDVAQVETGDKEMPPRINDIYEAAQDFLDYMVFAWKKAEDERGLSASRSVSKLGEWLWLMGRDDLRRVIHDEDLYNPYGAPALIEVCRQLGIEEVPESLMEFAKHKCK